MTKALTAVLLAIAICFAMPLVIGIFGAIFGIFAGVFGAIIGVFGAVFGAVFGSIGWVLEAVFGGGFITFLVIVVLVVALTRRKK